MGLFSNEFLNVIEWNETRGDILFWKWPNNEIRKNSRLIIRPGQDAIFLNNGKIEGVFTDEGNYEVETEIIPVLSTLKGFKFGFKTGLKAEVVFINTKEFEIKWGTKNPINLKDPRMPGGMPIRAFGSFVVKIDDYMTLIDNIAGVKAQFTVEDVKSRALARFDQLLMKSIVREGKDMFNLQANAVEISNGIKEDLDMEMMKLGLTVVSVTIENFNYPEAIQKMIEKNASYSMVGDVGHYQNVAMVEAMEKNPSSSMANMAQAGMGMQMGMEMMKKVKENFAEGNKTNESNTNSSAEAKCYNCNEPVKKDAKFCTNCGTKDPALKSAAGDFMFCSECGAKIPRGSKFCSECGNKL